MPLVEKEVKDEIATLRMNNGTTNPLNLEFVMEMIGALEEVQGDPSIKAMVLVGNDKFFCIGFDLPKLIRMDMEAMGDFYRAFNLLSQRLYTFPKPAIAAITGHATAGGCIIALACDYRYISEGKNLMGLNEIKLGIPVPYPADRMLHQIVGSMNARKIMESGDFYGPEDSLSMGLVDRILPSNEVVPKALEKATRLAAFPSETYSMIKANRVGPVNGQILAHLEKREMTFLSMWFKDTTRERLEEALKRF